MGCTSSAPNTLPLNANTADKSIQFEEKTNGNPSIEVDVDDIEDENQINQTKVLPSCDTTEQPVKLARNKSTNSLEIENGSKDVPANGHFIEIDNVNETLTNTQDEVKIPKLELLMDKVFESNHHLNDDKLNGKIKSHEENPPIVATEDAETTKNDNEESETKDESEPNEHINEENKADVEEEASPSQSQSSRATRWEALADIAAELPPSLAVDPITGQIYQIAQPK